MVLIDRPSLNGEARKFLAKSAPYASIVAPPYLFTGNYESNCQRLTKNPHTGEMFFVQVLKAMSNAPLPINKRKMTIKKVNCAIGNIFQIASSRLCHAAAEAVCAIGYQY